MVSKDYENIYFSIVIPSYNSSKTIKKTILSCLSQSYSNFEIIVIDDFSNDDSVLIIENLIQKYTDFKIRLFSMEINSGPSKCRNNGWEYAKGEYVAFLDSDDIWDSNKLKIIYSYLKKSHCIDLLAHGYTDDNYNSLKRYEYKIKKISFYKLLLKNISQTSAVTVRKSLKERFDINMRYTEDHDLWLRISFNHNVYFLEGEPLTILSRPQLSAGGLSGNKLGMRLGEINMYLKSTKYSFFSLIFIPLLIVYSFLKYVRMSLKQMTKK